MTGVLHTAPLLEEQVLHQLVQPDLPGAARGPSGKSRRIALCDVGFPAGPGRLVLRVLDRHEQREVVEPARLIAAEAIEAIAFRRWRCLLEPIQDARPDRAAVLDDGGEVDATVLKPRGPASLVFSQQSVLDQPFGADEQRIAGERREALIWRIAVAGRAERQDLPDSLALGREPVDELDRPRSEVPDIGPARERSRMEEDATGPSLRHTLYRCGAASASRAFFARSCCSMSSLAASRPPSPKAMASPSMSAPNVIANAVSATVVASPSCSSAITAPMAMTSTRSAPLISRAPGSPAFTDASSVARQRKLPTRKPSARTSSATMNRGTNRKNSPTSP